MVQVMVVKKLFHTGADGLMYFSQTIVFGQEHEIQPRRQTIPACFFE